MFIFSRDNKSAYPLICLTELHKLHSVDVCSIFSRNGYRAYYNPAVPSSGGGSHGGELVACRKDFNSMPVQTEILERISAEIDSHLSFAACYLRFRHWTVVIASVYLRSIVA